MDTNKVGDRTVGAVMSALLKEGMTVLPPVGTPRYDLVIESNGQFLRVQCKTGWLTVGGCIEFNACSVHGRNPRIRHNYRGQVELFGVFCPETEGTYLVPVDEVGTSKGYLRIAPTGNGRRDGIRYADEYTVQARGAAVARLLDMQKVGGSNPSGPTSVGDYS